jgi:hypothetical protein
MAPRELLDGTGFFPRRRDGPCRQGGASRGDRRRARTERGLHAAAGHTLSTLVRPFLLGVEMDAEPPRRSPSSSWTACSGTARSVLPAPCVRWSSFGRHSPPAKMGWSAPLRPGPRSPEEGATTPRSPTPQASGKLGRSTTAPQSRRGPHRPSEPVARPQPPGAALRIAELGELAASVGLAGSEGAKVRASSLRRRYLRRACDHAARREPVPGPPPVSSTMSSATAWHCQSSQGVMSPTTEGMSGKPLSVNQDFSGASRSLGA